MNNKRFELRSGKFGSYFFDTEQGLDMPLDIVLAELNKSNKPEIIGKKVRVFDRYRFAIPVMGTVTDFSEKDGAFKIDFFCNQQGGPNVTKYSGGYFFKEQCEIIND